MSKRKKTQNGRGFGASNHKVIKLQNDTAEIREELELPVSPDINRNPEADSNAAQTISTEDIADFAPEDTEEATSDSTANRTISPDILRDYGHRDALELIPPQSQGLKEIPPVGVNQPVIHSLDVPAAESFQFKSPRLVAQEKATDSFPARLAFFLYSEEYSALRGFLTLYGLFLFVALLFGGGTY